MITSISRKFLTAAALAAAVLGAAPAAQAQSDVYFSIGVQTPPVYVQPAPTFTYTQPRPVYMQPRPVYMQPPVYYTAPAPVYLRPGIPPYGYAYQDGRDWRRDEWQRRHWRQPHRDWEQSRDGNED